MLFSAGRYSCGSPMQARNEHRIATFASIPFDGLRVQPEIDATTYLPYGVHVKASSVGSVFREDVCCSPQKRHSPTGISLPRSLLFLFALPVESASHRVLNGATSPQLRRSQLFDFSRRSYAWVCYSGRMTSQNFSQVVPFKTKTGSGMQGGCSYASQSASMSTTDCHQSASRKPERVPETKQAIVFCDSERWVALVEDHCKSRKRVHRQQDIIVHGPSGSHDQSPVSDLDIGSVQRGLTSRRLGRVIVYSHCVPSTQDLLQTTLGRKIPGAVAVTPRQTAGRGRQGSKWLAPTGSLAFSMHLTIPVNKPDRLIYIQYVAALAAVTCIESHPSWSCIPARIKWPNDVYVDGYKVGGVLCEAFTQGDRFDVIVGVGVNVLNQVPTLSLESCRTMNGGSIEKPITRDAFLTAYLNAFEMLFNQFDSDSGFEALQERYLSSWLHTNQEITLTNLGNRRARVTGLAPNGYVRARCVDNDQVIDLSPDVTSLELTSGVIRDKIAS